jgi:hypothetical protein
MKRRIIVAASTLAAVAGIFVFYQLFVSSPSDQGAGQQIGPAGRGLTDQDLLDSQEHQQLIYEDRDPKTGRLTGIYSARRWSKTDELTYQAQAPRLQLMQEDGRMLDISAREGTFDTDQIGRDIEFRHGRLAGDVCVLYDRATREDRADGGVKQQAPADLPPLEQRPWDRIEVRTGELEFDLGDLVIFTSDRVEVEAREAKITGKGLALRWNESPDELRSLRIDQGERMEVYDPRVRENLIALPGRQESLDVSAGAEAPLEASQALAAQPGPADSAAAAAEPPTPAAASQEDAAPAAQPPRPEMPVLAPLEMPEYAPQPPPSTPPKPRNVYEASFSKDVTASQGNSTLTGADQLTLRFEYEGDKLLEGGRESPSASPAQPEGDNSAPAGAGGDTSTVALGHAAADGAASRPSDRQDVEPLVITWTGPLELKPVGYAQEPSRRRYHVTGQGRQVLLKDAQQGAAATCRSFSFIRLLDPKQAGRSLQQGRLFGAADQPVVLTGQEAERIECRELAFDPTGLAVLQGAGLMDIPPQTSDLESAATPPELYRITWADKLGAQFETRTDPAGRQRTAIRRAVFSQDVKLVQGHTGDTLTCDVLEARLGLDGKRPFIEHALAWGNAHTMLSGDADWLEEPSASTKPEETRQADVNAGALVIWFDPPAAEGRRRQPRPRRIVGAGGVRVRGVEDEQPFTVMADSMVAAGRADVVNFFGQPARVRRGSQAAEAAPSSPASPPRDAAAPESLEGRHIRLSRADRTVEVVGPGMLHFLTDRDLGGQELAAPRPVEVAWADSMFYRQREDLAEFAGRVKWASGNETLACDRMGVHLANAPDRADAQDQGFALGAGALGMGNLEKVTAEGQVTMNSHSQDEQNHLTGRLTVNGARLLYDARAKTLTMFDAGDALLEDYRPPSPEDVRAAQEPPPQPDAQPGLDRPSITAFTWNRSMELVQLDRDSRPAVDLRMAGDVKMLHRSGQQVREFLTSQDMAGLNLPPWPDVLPAGRKTAMRCEELLAQLEKRPSSGVGAPDRPGGLAYSLDRFEAAQAVLLEDGDYRVEAQRVIYDRQPDIVWIYGYLQDQRPADATFTTRQPYNVTRSPEFTWVRGSNRVYTGAIRGTGATLDKPK